MAAYPYALARHKHRQKKQRDCDENQNHARADCCGDVLVLSVEKPVMQEFIDKGITQEELDAAKAFLLGSEPLGEETLSQRLNVKLMNYMRNLPLDNHKKDIAKIAHLSLKEINDFIAKHPEILKLSISFVEEQ